MAALGVVATLCGLTALGVWLETAPAHLPQTEVQDVTGLVRIDTDFVARPHSVDEVRRLVREHHGPISIGGGRYSMGGQVGTDGTLFLDLREMDDIQAFDPEARTIRVEAGASWRTIIEHIDPHDLSVRIMQSYANFTVGGSLSVNAHGRYVGEGPLAHSVRELDLVLASGDLVRCSRTENPELFWAVVGGYGGLGVITAVTLDLSPNEALARTVQRMPASEFFGWFEREMRHAPNAVFFNADLYPPDYDDLVAITFSRTDEPVTIPERLQQPGLSLIHI